MLPIGKCFIFLCVYFPKYINFCVEGQHPCWQLMYHLWALLPSNKHELTLFYVPSHSIVHRVGLFWKIQSEIQVGQLAHIGTLPKILILKPLDTNHWICSLGAGWGWGALGSSQVMVPAGQNVGKVFCKLCILWLSLNFEDAFPLVLNSFNKS